MPIETKLRDVVDSAMADLFLKDQQVADNVMRILRNATSIELDDGTLFVRRTPAGTDERQWLLQYRQAVLATSIAWADLEATLRDDLSGSEEVSDARQKYDDAMIAERKFIAQFNG